MDIDVRLNQLQQRLERLEAARSISACMHEYMHLCDHLDAGFDLDPLLALFTEDAIWEGRGKRYAGTFGRCEGATAVRDMFAKYTRPPAHFGLNVHFLTSERINVDSETEALGEWVLLQTATFADGRSQLSSARLEVRFRQQAGAWRISHFQTESLFNRPVATPWDDPKPLPVPE
jgi:ketosteroid isomerase-like protein